MLNISHKHVLNNDQITFALQRKPDKIDKIIRTPINTVGNYNTDLINEHYGNTFLLKLLAIIYLLHYTLSSIYIIHSHVVNNIEIGSQESVQFTMFLNRDQISDG